MSILKRGTSYSLKRRVPLRFRSVEPRVEIWLSLKTDSPKEAAARAADVWTQMLARWEAMVAGNSSDAADRYQAAKDIAKHRGFRFMPVDRVAALPIGELIARVNASKGPDGALDMTLASGLLGTARKPSFTLSKALEEYWSLAVDKMKGKSEDQIRRAKNPRKKAFKNLIDLVGDIDLKELTPAEMQDFRQWWWDKIEAEDLDPASGNKDFTYIASTIRRVNTSKMLGLLLPFEGINFETNPHQTRLPFSEKWLREKLCDSGALKGLNTEARCVLLGMVNTGYRPSEGQCLGRDQIRLDTKFPHISIEPVGRTLKTPASRRVIPLAGVSLEAFKACPDGFPRYAHSAGLSATVNKFLRENSLLESANHTLYGLRHSFEDRLLDRGVDERIRRDLMGHALKRERYGAGASPEKLAALIKSIAI
jgi:integrase